MPRIKMDSALSAAASALAAAASALAAAASQALASQGWALRASIASIHAGGQSFGTHAQPAIMVKLIATTNKKARILFISLSSFGDPLYNSSYGSKKISQTSYIIAISGLTPFRIQ
jgi:hypothetical protein